MKKLLPILFILTAILLSACGGNSDSASANGESIRAITTAGGYPFNATNTETQELEGFMIDIMNTISERSGHEVEFTTGEWNSLIPSVQSDKQDVIVDGMYITEERKEIINFTDPVFAYGEGLIVQQDDTETKTLEDLSGKKVGVQIGTSYADMLEEKGAAVDYEIVTYQTLADMLKDISNGRIDAALADYPTFTYLQGTDPDSDFKIVEDYEPSLAGEIGIGISKDQEGLLEDLNAAIAEIKEDGTLKEIYEKWSVDWDFE